ncbi:unnamed protein product [Trifolium pratense]|uniref:Uncharacterized protein n=1 Tax=Trifolium pratense TaxID=57577 RepID=A0ACB0IY55_TRIPR|nr:unnamed protein product [Trifolium pratense]
MVNDRRRIAREIAKTVILHIVLSVPFELVATLFHLSSIGDHIVGMLALLRFFYSTKIHCWFSEIFSAVGNDRRVKSIEEIDGSVEEVEGSLGQHLRCSENIQDIDVKDPVRDLTAALKYLVENRSLSSEEAQFACQHFNFEVGKTEVEMWLTFNEVTKVRYVKDFFSVSSTIGVAADSWMALMDRLLILRNDVKHEKEVQQVKINILKLSNLYYKALDAHKKGGGKIQVPEDLTADLYPHYMNRYNSFTSTSILGSIFDEVCRCQITDMSGIGSKDDLLKKMKLQI